MTGIANKLREKMYNGKHTIYSLASEAAISPSSIKNILYGKSRSPRYELLKSLSGVLGCKIDDLLSDSDPRKGKDHAKLAAKVRDSWNQELYFSVVQTVAKISRDAKLPLSEAQAKQFINKIYTYSKKDGVVDEKFATFIVSGGKIPV